MNKKTLYQANTFATIQNKHYKGDMSLLEVLKKGKFGVGTFNYTDGEFILKDGIPYLADTNMNLVKPSEKLFLPLYSVGDINNSQKSYKLSSSMKMKDFLLFLENQLNLKNYPALLNIEVSLESALLRSIKKQEEPFLNFIDSLKKYEVRKELKNLEGSLIGVWYPKHLQPINNSGFHFHFIDKTNKIGGHLLDFEIKPNIKIAFEEKTNLVVEFSENEDLKNLTII
ncbi:acetolactate decarboxylase [[Mycoplasma] mobile]|uniref:Alpha-acetolactate decarboxylase n=1 Tax=Mycoplasma mobile (strain ATCC 43663 / 163K / NCTC 11711) TaxID=267748 RepID=Q6KI89_MYCM1|nr:acetolactate decarboxylase [[Mycoplasma] mobile]AAT27687.1 alpha-acetolactate decarboxylase [Mycoplasma mobile 163K]